MAKAVVVKKNNGGTIAQNKRARHDYFIEEKFEAGMSLQGWEVKSLRAGRMSLTESYIIFKNGEAYLFGAQIQPLLTASSHVVPEATRTRKLLLSRRQIDQLMGAVNQKGYSCVPLACYWKGHLVNAQIKKASIEAFFSSGLSANDTIIHQYTHQTRWQCLNHLVAA